MKKIVCMLLLITLALGMCGCGDSSVYLTSPIGEMNEAHEPVKLSFMSEFYDNSGHQWFSVEGSNFDISPNKIKTYGYSSDGTWTYKYETSSIVSITVDGKPIETCGSTVIFYDTRLEKLDLELPQDTIDTSEGGDASIAVPRDLRWRDSWTINYWWMTKDIQNRTQGKRLVLIQSQEGDPICMFAGDNVSWDIPTNLPKTTELCIDGKMIYIHRANFSIIDASFFN